MSTLSFDTKYAILISEFKIIRRVAIYIRQDNLIKHGVFFFQETKKISSEVCKNKVPWSMEHENVVVGFACNLVFHFCCIDPTSFVLPLPIFVFSPYHSSARTTVEPPLETPRTGPWSPDFCLRFRWTLVVARAVPTLKLHHNHIIQQ